MSVLWTHYGSKALLERAFREPPTVTLVTTFGLPLIASPTMDPTKETYTDWPFTFTKTSPGFVQIGFSTPWSLSIVGGRAVGQWGPPAFALTVTVAFTCYGFIWANASLKVLWADKWDTPRAYAIGDTLQILPWVTMVSECPPLGGC